jgi:hypothetical protein
MLSCASIVFLSRPEPGVICMTDGDFARVVATKKGETKTKQFCDWRKMIRIIF